jgi:hypothetical protein
LRMDTLAVSRVLISAPLEAQGNLADSPAILPLPLPDGTYVRFRIQESPLLGPALAQQFPEIKSYRGESLEEDSPAGQRLTMRAAWSPAGLHATILSNGEVVVVSTDNQNNGVYLSQTGGPIDASEFSCGVTDTGEPESVRHDGPRVAVGGQLRTFRLALAATWEYCNAFGGGTNAGTVASLNTWVNAANGRFA